MTATTSAATARVHRQGRASAGRRYGGLSAAERREERRSRLLDAGMALFGTQGYAATSIDELCSTAGISTRTFYEEVGGREELLLLLHDVVMRRADAAVGTALAGAPADDVEARATAAMTAFVHTMTADARAARIAYVEVVGVSPEVERQRHAWMSRFARLIDAEATALAERGLAPRRDFGLTAVAVVGAIDHLVVHWAAAPRRRSRARLVTEMVRFTAAALLSP